MSLLLYFEDIMLFYELGFCIPEVRVVDDLHDSRLISNRSISMLFGKALETDGIGSY